MNESGIQSRAIERALLVAVLVVQLLIFWQLRAEVKSGKSSLAEGGQMQMPDASGADHGVAELPDEAQAVDDATSGAISVPDAAAFDSLMTGAVESMARLKSAMQFERGWDRLPASPTLDMRDTGDDYLVTVFIPGMVTDELGVLLEGRVLTVRAWCPSGRHPESGQHYERRILLPGPVGRLDAAQANLTNGVLRVHVPKGIATEPQRIVVRLF